MSLSMLHAKRLKMDMVANVWIWIWLLVDRAPDWGITPTGLKIIC